MADLDASLVQQIFDIAKRKWEPNIQHRCKADDLRARLQISKWAVFCHQATLGRRTASLKPVSSDSAHLRSLDIRARQIHPKVCERSKD
jgi:hypothetical protein